MSLATCSTRREPPWQRADPARGTTRCCRRPSPIRSFSHALDLLERKKFDDARDESHGHAADSKPIAARHGYGGGAGLGVLGKNDPAAAIPDFEHALRLAPNFAAAYCQRGRAYAMMAIARRAYRTPRKQFA